MTYFDKIKKEVANIKNPMEFIGYIEGFEVAVAMYYKKKIEDVSIEDMKGYLESEIIEDANLSLNTGE